LEKENSENRYPHARVNKEKIANVTLGGHPFVRIYTEYSKHKAFYGSKKRIESAALFKIH
jgi:hypothetical protein